MNLHQLKVRPEYYEALLAGTKPFEVRKDDRTPPFAVGDVLELVRVDESGAIGWPLRRRITFALRDFPGVEPGYVVMGLQNA